MTTATAKTTTISRMRAEFATMRRNAGFCATREEWNASVVAVMESRGIGSSDATPAQWLDAARDARTACERCNGTGTYSWGGTINGKPVHTGDCYQCEGRGTQGQDDYRRNYGYTLHMIVNAIS